MRNPKWHRDELILTLDLYFELDGKKIYSENPLIVELSEVLNKLPIYKERPDAERFRNPNGVSLKLSNFLAIDDKPGGMSRFSKLDKIVFQEFKNKKTLLKTLANAIKTSVTNEEVKQSVLSVNENFEDDEFSRMEGTILYKYHLYRERNPTLVKKKKEQALKTNGKLECECCSFDFEKVYGEAGIGFMECHHTKALHTLNEKTKTTLKDLILVCANCHRMLHREWDMKLRS